MPVPLSVLCVASLFPDATRRNFGIFVERQLLEIARDADVDLTIVAPIGVPPWPLSLHPRYRKFAAVPARENWKGLKVLRPRFIALPGTGGRFAPYFMAIAVLKAICGQQKNTTFDIVDAQFFFPDGPAAQRIAAKLSLPYSIKARGHDISYWAKQAATREIVREAGTSAAGMLAVSEALKRDMAALGLPADRITVHYTGLDAGRFKPQDRDAAKSALGLQGPVIATVGALIERKGQALVIEALSRLPDVTYMIVGDGPDKARLLALAQRLGVADRVRLLGPVPHDNLPAVIAAADAMVLVSESEGLANAWLEALACGTPLILSDVGGARELVGDARTGRLVPRDPAAIAQAVRDILADPPSQEQVSGSVRTRFSWAKNARELASYWRRLVSAAK